MTQNKFTNLRLKVSLLLLFFKKKLFVVGEGTVDIIWTVEGL